MILTAAVAFFAGATMGLRFNVKMVAHASLLIILAAVVAAATGLTFATTAALYGVIAIIALQVGYSVTLILGAMGLTQGHAEETADDRTVSGASDIKPSVRPHPML
jgi:hypothetical protein